ncbi:MAG TPA: hypothetical protein VLA84_13825 [Microcoleus sp.]|nr:hypothetical protein [Microcoleus sp.]
MITRSIACLRPSAIAPISCCLRPSAIAPIPLKNGAAKAFWTHTPDQYYIYDVG